VGLQEHRGVISRNPISTGIGHSSPTATFRRVDILPGVSARITHEPPLTVPKSELLLMLQSLFEERFRMAVHHESRTVDVYKLVVAKGGRKLEETTTDGPSSRGPIPGGYAFKNGEIWRFCAFLSGRMGRPVIDQTSLAGIYNFTLRMDTLEGISSSDPDFKITISDWSFSSIFSDSTISVWKGSCGFSGDRPRREALAKLTGSRATDQVTDIRYSLDREPQDAATGS
jgi:hypothetical protein